MAKKQTHAQHCKEINTDVKRVQVLASTIFPGDGFTPDATADLPRMLLELLTIVGKYDDQDDRDFIIYHVGEAIYPTTYEGQGVITAFISSAAQTATGRREARDA